MKIPSRLKRKRFMIGLSMGQLLKPVRVMRGKIWRFWGCL